MVLFDRFFRARRERQSPSAAEFLRVPAQPRPDAMAMGAMSHPSGPFVPYAIFRVEFPGETKKRPLESYPILRAQNSPHSRRPSAADESRTR
jgi:hypothetical protein